MNYYSGSQSAVFFSELIGTTSRDIELEIYMPGDETVELAVFGSNGIETIELTGEEVDKLITQLQEARKRLP